MTLIPLISALAASPRTASSPAGATALLPRETYGSGTGHRPVAALLALGLPAALVVAVALSPMIIATAPTPLPTPWKSFTLPPTPPPPPDPTAEESVTPKTASATETVVTPIDTTLTNENVVETGPSIPDTPWTDPGPAVAPDPPAPPPKLVLAELDPKFAGLFQPDYPASEQRRELEGVAKVRVLIGTDGRVKAVELVHTDSRGFFEETKRRALSKWRFKPATRGGVAEESWKVMTVRFEIRNG